MNEPFDWRRSDRRIYLAAAILFPIIVLIGFGPTYYLRFAFERPPVPSLLVHVHGILMTTWVAFFVAQVLLIRTKRQKVHMNLGMLGIALAILVVVVGFFTAAASAKFGSAAAPPDVSPLVFLLVPMVDLLMFAVLFGGAIYYRKRPASHKRLMLLTVLNFLPPAVGRIPVDALLSAGPLFFFGVPSVLAIGLLVYDTWRNRKLNVPFLVGALVLIASFPLRIVISETSAWMSFAVWVTSWAA